MNIIKENDNIFIYESVWRSKKLKKDSNNKKFPLPKQMNYWSGKKQFLIRLREILYYLNKNKKFSPNNVSNKDCLICGKKNITSKFYNISNIFWEDGLYHYIKSHNIKPSLNFIESIYRYQSQTKSTKEFKSLHSLVYDKKIMKYIKIEKNQILIMDALMKHGGYNKKYSKNDKIFRNSEHTGLLYFSNMGLEKIIVSAKTSRVDIYDPSIYLPENMKDMIKYEYIFHTHPPTPKIGGRAIYNILYEFPSISDIFHFVWHFNKGKMRGSIIITPEGLYNIRKYTFDNDKIKLQENKIYKQYLNLVEKEQRKAIDKYGLNFNTYKFYSVIAQDIDYINSINHLLKTFNLYVDYFPRKRDIKGNWFIDDIFLPINFS